MVFNALHARDSMYQIGFRPALKINDVEVWVNADKGLYTTLWWIGEDPYDSPVLQSEHVRFMLDNRRRVKAVLEPGVMRTYVKPTHELWNMQTEEDQDNGNEVDEGGES